MDLNSYSVDISRICEANPILDKSMRNKAINVTAHSKTLQRGTLQHPHHTSLEEIYKRMVPQAALFKYDFQFVALFSKESSEKHDCKTKFMIILFQSLGVNHNIL